MRCFEIEFIDCYKGVEYELNNNMRCFEIGDKILCEADMVLNNNMRCFEMRKQNEVEEKEIS